MIRTLARHSWFKRGILCIVPVMILLSSLFGSFGGLHMNVSASDDDIPLPPELDFIARILKLPGMLEMITACRSCGLYDPNYSNGTMYCKKHYERMLEAGKLMFTPPDGGLTVWNDNDLLYQYRYDDKIQIGEYLFDKYEFGSTEIRDKVNAWYSLMVYQKLGGVKELKYHYIPFFIYEGDLYFEHTSPGTHFGSTAYNVYLYRALGYSFYYQPGNNQNDLMCSLSFLTSIGSSGHANFGMTAEPYIQLADSIVPQIYNTSVNGGTIVDFGSKNSSRWFNVSQFVRNRQALGLPTLEVTNGVVKTMPEIHQGVSFEYFAARAHNFTPDQLGTGVLVIPPDFYMETGMEILEYVISLMPVPYNYGAGIGEHNTPALLQEVFELLEDDDQVEITVNDDGTVTIVIVKGGAAGGDDTPGNGNGNGGDIIIVVPPGTGGGNGGTTAPSGFWESLLAMLERIIELLEDIARNTAERFSFEFDDSVILAAIAEVPKLVTDALQGAFDGIDSSFGVISTKANDMAESIGNINFDSIGDSINNSVSSIGDTISTAVDNSSNTIVSGITNGFEKLFSPGEDFLENEFNKLNGKFNEKFPLVNQVSSFYDEYIGALKHQNPDDRDSRMHSEPFKVQPDYGASLRPDMPHPFVPDDAFLQPWNYDDIFHAPGQPRDSNVSSIPDPNTEEILDIDEPNKFAIVPPGLYPEICEKCGVVYIALAGHKCSAVDEGGLEPKPSLNITKVPQFTITLFNTEVPIINFSLFHRYRMFVHALICGFAYFAFFKRKLKQIPKIIGGFH